jgi:hypothetical protein
MSHHHAYYVTSSYIRHKHATSYTYKESAYMRIEGMHAYTSIYCSERIHTYRDYAYIHTYPSTCSERETCRERARARECIHAMSHHHTYYVTSSYILCHIIIHTMSHIGRAHTYTSIYSVRLYMLVYTVYVGYTAAVVHIYCICETDLPGFGGMSRCRQTQ